MIVTARDSAIARLTVTFENTPATVTDASQRKPRTRKASSAGMPTILPQRESSPTVRTTPATRQTAATGSRGRRPAAAAGGLSAGASGPSSKRPRSTSEKSRPSDGTQDQRADGDRDDDRDERRAARGRLVDRQAGQQLGPLGERPAGDDRAPRRRAAVIRAHAVAALRTTRTTVARPPSAETTTAATPAPLVSPSQIGRASRCTTTRPASAARTGDDRHPRARAAERALELGLAEPDRVGGEVHGREVGGRSRPRAPRARSTVGFSQLVTQVARGVPDRHAARGDRRRSPCRARTA